MVNVIHIAEDFATTGGGVTSAIAELSGQLARIGLEQRIIFAGLDAIPAPKGVALSGLPLAAWGKKWRYPKGLRTALADTLHGNSVVHLHGIWMAPQYLVSGYAVQQGVPVVMSAHNMLGDWFWRDGTVRQLKKSLYWNYISSPRFQKITALHALTPLERDAVQKYFPKKQIQVIPNGIDVVGIDKYLSDAQKTPATFQGKYILILGRLHHVKGIDIFIKAYSRIPAQHRIPVIVAGPSHTEAYTAKLKGLVRELGLEAHISFVGPVYGHEKWTLTRNAWALCAPSYSEGMSMVALEAMSCAVPIVTTHTAGIGNVPEGGGLLVNPNNVDELAAALIQVMSWGDVERLARGNAARRLVERHYDWAVVGPQYLRFYESLKS